MEEQFKSIPGTFDILPDPSTSSEANFARVAAWQHVENTVRSVMHRFSMEEIRTPVLEPTPLIARGIGEYTDIVTKEMFAFERGDTHYVLRPEVTAPVIRAYLQHHLEQRGGAQRLFYIGPCFRAERPQKGRYRQFHQFGSEIIGTDDPRADVECIAAMLAVLQELGLSNYSVLLNSIGNPESRNRYVEALTAYLEQHRKELTETSRRRLEENPLRVLDTKEEHERALLREAPVITEYLDENSRAHYDEVKQYLADLDIAFKEDPYLVRGLDYYTRTAFEIEHSELGAQSALGGGGRYDLLAQELGSAQPVPAVGFAAGIERILLAMEAEKIEMPETAGPQVFLAALGDRARRRIFIWAQELRRDGLSVGYDLRGRSLKAQMREANRQRAHYALIIGDRELDDGRAQVKDMETGEQVEVAFDDLAAHLQGQLLTSAS